jgi:hypothetical protein
VRTDALAVGEEPGCCDRAAEVEARPISNTSKIAIRFID